MPIYEFRCKHCENVFEFLCIHSDGKNAAMCPACGGKESEKLLSAFSTVSSNSHQGLSHNLASSSCSSKGGFS
jgi:putative FmdB family regulatory protein